MKKITKEEKKEYLAFQDKFSTVEEKVLSCIWLMENFPSSNSEAMMLLMKAYISFQELVNAFYKNGTAKTGSDGLLNADSSEGEDKKNSSDTNSFTNTINDSIKDVLKRFLKPKDYKFYEDNYEKFFSYKDKLFKENVLTREDKKLIEKFCEILSISLNKVINEIQKKYLFDLKSVLIRSIKWIVLALLIIGGVLYYNKAQKYGTYNYLKWKPFDADWSLKVINQDWGQLAKELSVERNDCIVPSEDTGKNVAVNDKPKYKTKNCYGTHANSKLELSFEPKFEKFEGACGKDLECGFGSVVCVIKDKNNKVLFESGVLTNDTKLAKFSVPVKGLDKIYLEMTNANDGNGCDHADWLDLVIK